jgi:hypothetical protein
MHVFPHSLEPSQLAILVSPSSPKSTAIAAAGNRLDASVFHSYVKLTMCSEIDVRS